MQAARRQAVRDRIGAQSELEQLSVGDDAVLPPRNGPGSPTRPLNKWPIAPLASSHCL
jgi:hypothetical protein